MKKFLLASLIILLTFCAIGLTACEHEHDYKVQSSDTMHWYKCECGDTIGYDVHVGGEATCKEKAKCSTCGIEYGELGEHSYSQGNCKWCKKEQCEGLLFELINDTEYVVKEIGDFEGRELVIPSIHLGKPVTSIGNNAFYNCSSLKAIEIPNSVTSIGNGAFEFCRSLEAIEIPNSVTSIGERAFAYCHSLTSIVIPNSVTSIGGGAFHWCSSLTSVVIPNSVTSIGEDAFCRCSKLTIYCKVESKPEGWDSAWKDSNCPVVWGYKGN